MIEVWVRADGTRVRIDRMSRAHAYNIVRYFAARGHHFALVDPEHYAPLLDKAARADRVDRVVAFVARRVHSVPRQMRRLT